MDEEASALDTNDPDSLGKIHGVARMARALVWQSDSPLDPGGARG